MYVQSMLRECSEYVHSMFRAGSGQVQSRFRAGSEYVQSMFGVCFISSSSASSVSVFGIFYLYFKCQRESTFMSVSLFHEI